MRIRAAHRHSARAGFSLVEILVVIAIIAMAGFLLLPGVNSILSAIREEAPDRMVWSAITAARARALEANRTVWMHFDSKTGLLQWEDGEKSDRRELPADHQLQFLQPKAAGQVLLGGVLVETREMPAVRFHPDGTCDPFRVQITRKGAAPLVFGVDPWTCAPVLPPETPR